MVYSEALADRIRQILGPRPDVSEKKMFGGVAFLLDGKMFCGIVKEDLMVRVGPDCHAEAIARPHARPMDFTGRPMVGYVFVAPPGCRSEKAVRPWVELALAHVATLPDKKKKTRSPKQRPSARRTRAR